MTLKQIVLLVACVLLGTSAAWHAHRRADALREQIKALQTGQMTPEDEAALTEERDRARAETQRIAAEAVELRAASADLLKLRGEVTLLRREARGDGQLGGGGVAGGQGANDGVSPATLATLASNVASLKQALQKAPAQQVPELCLLEEQDWIKAAREAKMDTEDGVLKSLSRARTLAKERLIPMMSQALHGYVEANNGQLPSAITQLGPYFHEAVDASIFERYELIKTGDSRELKPADMVIQEKNRLTPHDSVFRLGMHGWGFNSP
jgi:hypothetical protein